MTQAVCVVNRHGKPLMPTIPRKARLLLKEGKARILRYQPFFTIQLCVGVSGYRQVLKLGIDSGYVHVGFSAITAQAELLGGELHLLKGMTDRLAEKQMYRRNRRQRKRYRPKRFNNRKRRKGWLAPSIQHKLDSHRRFITLLEQGLPITEKTIEIASFDIHKLKNPTISSKGYQQGEQQGFWNLHEYILHRDKHQCQNPECQNKAAQPKLQVHHIGYWKKDKSDRPGNLITLCNKCHTPKNHLESGWLHGWQPEIATKGWKAETFMTSVRQKLIEQVGAKPTYGYLTKLKRFELNLSKSHATDAFLIAGGTTQPRAELLQLKQIRRNNRQLQKFYDAKYLDTRSHEPMAGQELFSGRRTRNKTLNEPNLRPFRGHKLRKGRNSIRRQRYRYQPKDIVKYHGKNYTVKGMQNYGRYIKLAGLRKPVNIDTIFPVCWRKGFCVVR